MRATMWRLTPYGSYVLGDMSWIVGDRGYVPPKSPIISGSFAKRDLQLKASYAS